MNYYYVNMHSKVFQLISKLMKFQNYSFNISQCIIFDIDLGDGREHLNGLWGSNNRDVHLNLPDYK